MKVKRTGVCPGDDGVKDTAGADAGGGAPSTDLSVRHPYPGRDRLYSRLSQDEVKDLVWPAEQIFDRGCSLQNLHMRISRCTSLPESVKLVEYQPETEGRTYSIVAGDAEVEWLRDREKELSGLMETDRPAGEDEAVRLRAYLSELFLPDVYRVGAEPYPERDPSIIQAADGILLDPSGTDLSPADGGCLEYLGIQLYESPKFPFYTKYLEIGNPDDGSVRSALVDGREVSWLRRREESLADMWKKDSGEASRRSAAIRAFLFRKYGEGVQKPRPDALKVKGPEDAGVVPAAPDGCADGGVQSGKAGAPFNSDNLKAFRDTIEEMYALYEKKNSDYTASEELGSAFEFTYRLFGLTAPGVRLADKFIRYVALATGKEQMVGNESIEDTLIDMANYAVMTLMEIRKGRK